MLRAAMAAADPRCGRRRGERGLTPRVDRRLRPAQRARARWSCSAPRALTPYAPTQRQQRRGDHAQRVLELRREHPARGVRSRGRRHPRAVQHAVDGREGLGVHHPHVGQHLPLHRRDDALGAAREGRSPCEQLERSATRARTRPTRGSSPRRRASGERYGGFVGAWRGQSACPTARSFTAPSVVQITFSGLSARCSTGDLLRVEVVQRVGHGAHHLARARSPRAGRPRRRRAQRAPLDALGDHHRELVVGLAHGEHLDEVRVTQSLAAQRVVFEPLPQLVDVQRVQHLRRDQGRPPARGRRRPARCGRRGSSRRGQSPRGATNPAWPSDPRRHAITRAKVRRTF